MALTLTLGSGIGIGLAGLAGVGALVGGAALLKKAAIGRFGRRRFRGGRRRFGRSTEEEEAVKSVMALVWEEDQSGCARRMACELGGREEASLTQEELDILALVGPSVRPGEGVLPESSAVMEYRVARGYGEAGGDCSLAFPQCPFTAQQLINAPDLYLP